MQKHLPNNPKKHSVRFSCRYNDGTIWVCGRRNLTASVPAPGELADPDEDMIEELKGHVRRWLNSECTCGGKHVDGFQLWIKVELLDLRLNLDCPFYLRLRHQIWPTPRLMDLLPGHGSYGLTLGMGTGKLMSQLMLGEKTDIDLSIFALSRDVDTAQRPKRPDRRYKCSNM